MREVSEQQGAVHVAAGLCTKAFALFKQFVVYGTAVHLRRPPGHRLGTPHPRLQLRRRRQPQRSQESRPVPRVTGPAARLNHHRASQPGSAIDRLDGYCDVLLDGRPQLIVEGDFTLQGAADAMVLLLDRCPGLDTVFVDSSLIATGALWERGLQYAKVAVVGFDDLARAHRRSNVSAPDHRDQNLEGMGRLMAWLGLPHTGRVLVRRE